MPPKPRRWPGVVLGAFSLLTLAAFWTPLFVPSVRRLGVRVRRKRLFTACVAAFLTPLMAVDPQTVDAMYSEALAYQALAASGAIGQACPVGSAAVAYCYDANGSLRQRHENGALAGAYTFDAENRLVAFTPATGSAAGYTYDAAGIRNSVTAGGHTTWHLTDKNQAYAQVLTETDAAAATLNVRYVYGDDLISQHRDATTGTRYYHYDGQMSTRALCDSFGTITDEYDYSAYGVALKAVGAITNTYRYSGEQLDPTLQLIYLRARYYHAPSGRFIARDPFHGPMGDPNSIHRYTYAHGNPVDNTDPSGLWPNSTVTLVAVIALGALILSLALLLPAIRNTSSLTGGPGTFVPVHRSQLKVDRQSVQIANSKLSADKMFATMMQFATLNLYPVHALSSPATVGDSVGFDMLPKRFDLGQGDFYVRVTQFNSEDRFVVVRTLRGHPLAGWRYFGVHEGPNGDLVVETFEVVHPATTFEEYVKFRLGGAGNQQKSTWYHWLDDLVRISGGGIRVTSDSNMWGESGGSVDDALKIVAPGSEGLSSL